MSKDHWYDGWLLGGVTTAIFFWGNYQKGWNDFISIVGWSLTNIIGMIYLVHKQKKKKKDFTKELIKEQKRLIKVVERRYKPRKEENQIAKI